MEEKIVKVYSNNSKKSRIKRRKNKFQRIWDPKKGEYVKVRKAKYPVKTKTVKKDWRDIDDMTALKRRQSIKKPKSVPVNAQQTKTTKVYKSETKNNMRKEPARISKTKAVTVNLHGSKLEWDNRSMRYKNAA